jgi:hypothetical protein
MRLVLYEEKKVCFGRFDLPVYESHLFYLPINHGGDCFIKVTHEKGTTMAWPSHRRRLCGLTVQPTTARPPHQRRPCGSVSQPWPDCPIKVGYAEPTRFITTMVATSTLSMRNKKWASTNPSSDCFIYVVGAQPWSLLRSLVDTTSKDMLHQLSISDIWSNVYKTWPDSSYASHV